MNPTIEKFGYPATLIKEYEHWVVLLRPAQVTFGSLVLAAKSGATAYSELPPEAFAEQAMVIVAVEDALKRLTRYDRINYLMLMMVDPNVHFHVIPRYSEARSWNGPKLPDLGWPGTPRLDSMVKLRDPEIAALCNELICIFR